MALFELQHAHLAHKIQQGLSCPDLAYLVVDFHPTHTAFAISHYLSHIGHLNEFRREQTGLVVFSLISMKKAAERGAVERLYFEAPAAAVSERMAEALWQQIALHPNELIGNRWRARRRYWYDY